MRIFKNSQEITSLEEWRRLAPPKKAHQWAAGRSACESARSWIGSGRANMPAELRTLLDSLESTRDLRITEVEPELPIIFDDCGGEPRNADVAFVGEGNSGRVAVTIEAKADESFDLTLSKTLLNAQTRHANNPRSQGTRRIEQLVEAFFGASLSLRPDLLSLRYQLFTAAAGTLAYAIRNKAGLAVLIVHEFITRRTDERKSKANESDFHAFLSNLAGFAVPNTATGKFAGAFLLPGEPLFSGHPVLLIGKATVDLRNDGRMPEPA